MTTDTAGDSKIENNGSGNHISATFYSRNNWGKSNSRYFFLRKLTVM